MKVVALVILALLVSHALAATATTSFTVQALGAVHKTSEHTWMSGIDNESLSGSSGSVLVTAPGEVRYQTKDHIDARTGNFYNQTGYAEFTAGGVFEESVAMDNSDPYQSVVATHSGFMQAAQIDTAKFVDNADVSIGQQAAWDGAGMYSRDIAYTVAQERESMGHIYKFRTDTRSHEFVGTNVSGGAIARPEFEFIDFSDSFIVNDTALEANATNTTSDIVSEHTGVM